MQEIIDSTIPPSHPQEAAFIGTLPPGIYTAVLSGVNGGTGIGVVEAYDLDGSANSRFANIATRGRVQSGDNVMIGGLIVTGFSPQKVIVRAIGPSLPVEGKLENPFLELYDGNGTLLQANDNWRNGQGAEIEATTIPPLNDFESAIVTSLPPAAYTAIVSFAQRERSSLRDRAQLAKIDGLRQVELDACCLALPHILHRAKPSECNASDRLKLCEGDHIMAAAVRKVRILLQTTSGRTFTTALTPADCRSFAGTRFPGAAATVA